MTRGLERIRELLNAGRVADARVWLERLDPTTMSGEELGGFRALQAVCLVEQGRSREAEEVLAAVLAEHGADPSFLSGLDAMFASCPGVAGAPRLGFRRRIARCEEDHGDPEAAARTLRRLARDHPEEQGLWRELALCERRAGNPDGAAAAMRRYLHSDSEAARRDASAWASLGDFLDDAGRPDQAEHAWQRAIELDPEDPTFHYNRGVAAGRRLDLARVRECSDALRRCDPDGPLALALSSILLEFEGEVRSGWEAMLLAVESESDHDWTVALAHRALLYTERNDLGEPARKLIDRLHLRGLLDDDVLEVVNRIENRGSEKACDFSVLVDVLPDPEKIAGSPDMQPSSGMRYLRWLRVVADSADEAAHLATVFECRGGALEVRVDEVVDRGALEEPDHVGVWRFQDAPEYYRAQEGGVSPR